MNELNIISVDLEDWHDSAYLHDYVNVENKIDRIVPATENILNLFKKYNTKATFFTLGSIAEKYPELIKTISNEGHEIASHGFTHTPVWNHSPDEFENEIKKTNKLLEEITGKSVIGFRAPYASLNQETSWIIDVLKSEGFLYDASLFPMKTPLYGVKNAPLNTYRISSKNILEHDSNSNLIEIPFTIYKSALIRIPCTGGIYGRFMPFTALNILLKHIRKDRAVNFYFHPWETDKEIPRIKVPIKNRIISYYNTGSYLKKIEKLLIKYSFTSMEQYLSEKKLI
jgi:peptidoglycan-N-acetylglucosamine deacetylase